METPLNMIFSQIPVAEGLKVFAYGLSGVFIALGLLAAGLKVVSLVIKQLDSGKKES